MAAIEETTKIAKVTVQHVRAASSDAAGAYPETTRMVTDAVRGAKEKAMKRNQESDKKNPRRLPTNLFLDDASEDLE